MTTFQKNLTRFVGDTELILIAARMTEAGCPTTVAALKLWISGDRVPGSDRVVYLARALNVTPNDLLGFASEVA